MVINKRGIPRNEEAGGSDVGLFDHYADVFIPIEDSDIAECRWAVDHGAVRKALEKGVAFFRGGELAMTVGGEGGKSVFGEVEEGIKSVKSIAKNLPVAGCPCVTDAEFDSISGPEKRSIIAKELSAEFVTEEIVPSFQTDLIWAESKSFCWFAKSGTEGFEFGIRKAERDGEGDINMNSKEVNREDFHKVKECR